jgi:hypothetical protein
MRADFIVDHDRLGNSLPDVSLRPTPSAEQIMGMPAELRRRWTAREVRQLIDESPLATPRYELVDGELLVTRRRVHLTS